MLTSRQVVILLIIGLVLWGLTAAYIRLLPGAFVDPLWGPVMFFASPISIWLNIALVRKLSGLSKGQVLAGVALVGAVALMAEGLGLRFLPALDGQLMRFSAAWVVWSYGLSLAMALFISSPKPQDAPGH